MMKFTNRHFFFSGFTAVFVSLFLIGCGTPPDVKDEKEKRYDKLGSIFGDEGLTFSTGNKRSSNDTGSTSGIGVNGFLWRASLDTISFMPLTQVDPFGGVIISDWYTPENEANTRYKVTVYILSRTLRADGIRVKSFKQVLSKGIWKDILVSATTNTQMENAILTRARQLRVAALGNVEQK